MIPWPSAALPPPDLDWGNTVDPSVLRTRMDNGAFRQRRRFTQSLRTVDASWFFTGPEYDIFQTWHNDWLHGGNDWFSMVVPIGSTFKKYEFRFVSGGVTTRYVAHDNWDVKAKLETPSVAPGDDLSDLPGLTVLWWGLKTNPVLTESLAKGLQYRSLYTEPPPELDFYDHIPGFCHLLLPASWDPPRSTDGFYQDPFAIDMATDNALFPLTVNGWRYRLLTVDGTDYFHFRSTYQLNGRIKFALNY